MKEDGHGFNAKHKEFVQNFVQETSKEETLHISWTDNIEIDLWEVKWKSVDCIHHTEDIVQKEANI